MSIVTVLAAVIGLGAVIAYLALGASAVTSQELHTVRAAWIGMQLTGWYVIVPLAFASLLTGLVMSLGTPWGLFRHYWIVISFTLTAFSSVSLLSHMRTVSAMAFVAREADSTRLGELGGDLVHPGLGLMVLLAIMALNVYKPRDLTPYGWRKQYEERTLSQPKARRLVSIGPLPPMAIECLSFRTSKAATVTVAAYFVSKDEQAR